jgi:hypothetical protein
MSGNATNHCPQCGNVWESNLPNAVATGREVRPDVLSGAGPAGFGALTPSGVN